MAEVWCKRRGSPVEKEPFGRARPRFRHGGRYSISTLLPNATPRSLLFLINRPIFLICTSCQRQSLLLQFWQLKRLANGALWLHKLWFIMLQILHITLEDDPTAF